MYLKHLFYLFSIYLLAVNVSAEVNVHEKLSKLFNECVKKEEVIKCFKIHALKVLDRALHSKKLYLNDYVQLVVSDVGRSFNSRLTKNDSKLEELKSEAIDEMLMDTASKFFESHKLEVKLPNLIDEGRRTGGGGGGGGNKGGGGGNIGVLLGALAIKGTFLAMAYKGIAIMSGTALLVGKMALMLSAILGLKKLVGGGEKTTFEIVKHPKYSESHSHSTSYEDDGYYHHRRAYLEEPSPQTTTYKFYTTK
ncbi:uncharacterized protein LOC123680352 [Harmonia axyridis]|uniref:uncharacterized protein LOC123680352 n=1 Tax=Harmonia axyridis TaxID=115357 RepID=UPI001E277810|nr:uncharacterized protein LOC123680352 [Harmonia axyridis]